MTKILKILCTVLVLNLLYSCGGGGGANIAETPSSALSSSDTAPTDAGETSISDDDNLNQNELETDLELDQRLVMAATADPTQRGFQAFLSPHVNPIVLQDDTVYVTNTANGTVDVISANSRSLVASINVGIEPIALAVRPDGSELWVSNHVSDSINIIDIEPSSNLYHQVVGIIDANHLPGNTGWFDEPAGIAFASNEKAYVVLSQENKIAVINVLSREILRTIDVPAQDPRALAVIGDKLLVLPFESNNQTQLSGCLARKIDGDVCTFDAVEHVFTNNNVLSLNYTADIVKNPELPDRDLLVFDTTSDDLVTIVSGLGTLLYGITTTETGEIYIAQTDARNDVNGRAGSEQHGLAELGNRPFLNQITKVECALSDQCDLSIQKLDLEVPPTQSINPELALATPYALTPILGTEIIVGVASGSDRLFSLNSATGEIVDRLKVGGTPRGVAARKSSENHEVWVFNAVDNSLSIATLDAKNVLSLLNTIQLDDPTPNEFRLGRHLFESASASSTGTFSCASCHVDGHTDQLLWVLDTPLCDISGCTQIQPRLTMPLRGLRDTAPYHWDGVLGDPHGGINTANINNPILPDCKSGVALDCATVLVDSTLGSTMCGVEQCQTGPSGKLGKLTDEERSALAAFNLSVPFPPAPERPSSNALSAAGFSGLLEFHLKKDCGNCHRMPFLVSTNTPSTGMDAPTWRGAYDRWMILPQGRLNIADLMEIVNIPNHFPEKEIWGLAGASDEIWKMVTEGSTGFSAMLGDQILLQGGYAQDSQKVIKLNELTTAADTGSITILGTAIDEISQDVLEVRYESGLFLVGNQYIQSYSPTVLLGEVESGNMQIILTAHPPANAGTEYTQPGIWPEAPIAKQSAVIPFPELNEAHRLAMRGRHVYPNSQVFVDGKRVDAEVACKTGQLPDCIDEQIEITLDNSLEKGGFFQLRLQNPLGKFSNDMLFFSELSAPPLRPGNILGSDGSLSDCGKPSSSWEFTEFNGALRCSRRATIIAEVTEASTTEPWRVQLFHRVPLYRSRSYTACFDARASSKREILVYLDRGADRYQLLSDDKQRVQITTSWQSFRYSWEVSDTDISSRFVFDLAQVLGNVELDNISLVEGEGCAV